MGRRVGLAGLLVVCTAGTALAQESAPVSVPPSAAAAVPGDTTFTVENLTRAELWRFFTPPPGGGRHPDYAYIGSRATLGASYRGPRWGVRGDIQYVRLENLPEGAVGPGLLGSGGAYFFQAGGTFSYQFYLRALSLTWRDGRVGAWIEAGRFSRAAAAEPTSGDAAIDTLTRAHLNGRLLGDMEWSFYQRAWDGVRAGRDRGRWHAMVMAALPTQGTFEESANLTIDKVRVAAAEVRADPGALAAHTAVTVFAHGYDDQRRITARPDNVESSPPQAIAVRIGTAGASAVGAFPQGSRRWDAVVWTAFQSGDWYGQGHRAYAAAGQVGHQWTAAPGEPWLRAGLDYASGDGDGRDRTHGTFFPMLPSGDHLSRSSTYALMNVQDAWVEVRMSPTRALDAQAAVHAVGLAQPADRWYTGSGATARAGNYFGFQGRNTGGARTLGTVVEGELTWQPVRRWTLRGYAGRMTGGEAVQRLFAGDRLVTAWFETRFSF
ncbi:MAG TPA: alginate export family protein [Vicinamibacterales bacterium]|nr:alginate export family protein [Vicinamibacterales bacterium]